MTAQNAQSYDFRQQLDLLGDLVDRAKRELTPEQISQLQSAARNKKFSNLVQFAPYCTDRVHQITMQELSDLGANDPGIQQIDPKAIDRLLFGPYGMISHKKLKKGDIGKIGERPVIVYYQPDPDFDPEKPANASGRHRNYAWQILLHAAGISWDVAMQQPMWVDKTLARNKEEYTMMMTLANGQQARRQSPAELKSFDLTKRGIRIEDLNNLIATRLSATQGQMADVIATGVTMTLPTEMASQSMFIWDRVKTSWTKCVRISATHKQQLVHTFKTDGDQIRDLIYALSKVIPQIIDEEASKTSSKSYRERVNEGITDAICEAFKLPINPWETPEEKARRSLLDLEAKKEELQQFVTK